MINLILVAVITVVMLLLTVYCVVDYLRYYRYDGEE